MNDVISSFQDAVDKKVPSTFRLVNLCPHTLRLFLPTFFHMPGQGFRSNPIPPPFPAAGIEEDGWTKLAGYRGQWVELPAAEKPFRLAENNSQPELIEAGSAYPDWMWESPLGIMVRTVNRTFEAPELPPEAKDTIYLVSLPALMGLAAAGIQRSDIYAPDSGSGCVRSPDGQIWGVSALVKLGTGPSKMQQIAELSTVDDMTVRHAVLDGSMSHAHELANRLDKIRQLAST